MLPKAACSMNWRHKHFVVAMRPQRVRDSILFIYAQSEPCIFGAGSLPLGMRLASVKFAKDLKVDKFYKLTDLDARSMLL
jgi:hypothetical protein